MTQTRPATPTDLPDLVRKPLGVGRWRQVTREQLNPFADATSDHQSHDLHPMRAATGPSHPATIANGHRNLTLAPLPRTSKSTTGHVTVGNQQLRVDVRAGNGTGTPLLMCCGIGASFEVLQPLVDALDPGIDIIRFDVPGVGGSPVGALPNGFPQLARMLDRLLDELGYDRVDVLGFSWGGALAQQFAVQHAGRCRRLVLISTNTGVLSVPGAPGMFAKMATPRGTRDYAAAMAGSVHGGDARARTDDVRRLFRHTRVAVAGLG